MSRSFGCTRGGSEVTGGELTFAEVLKVLVARGYIKDWPDEEATA